MSRKPTPWSLGAIFLVAACGTPQTRSQGDVAPAGHPELAPAVGDTNADAPAAVPELRLAALRTIAELEDRRTVGPAGELLQFLAHEDAEIRARAATAVGRIRHPAGGEAATGALAALLADRDPAVRAAAAFGLGMREDPAACEALIQLARSDDAPSVRARAIEAASKLGPAAWLDDYFGALSDPAPEVRLEAACGTARWKADAPDAAAVNARLARFAAAEDDSRVRAHAFFALERRRAVEGVDACLAGSRSTDAEERLFAVRALARRGGERAIDEALIAATRDPDWRVAVEALNGLSQSSWLPALEAMAAAIGSENHHLRATAIESATDQLAAYETAGLLSKTQGLGNFNRIFSDPSPAVRAAAVANLMRHSSMPMSEQVGSDPSPHVRAAFVRGFAKREPKAFFDLSRPPPRDSKGERGQLLQDWAPAWAGDKNLLVRGAMVEALAEVEGPLADARLCEFLADEDNGLRFSAVTTLFKRAEPVVDAQVLLDCFRSSQGEVGAEVRFNVLRLAGKLGGGGHAPLFQEALGDPDPFVRATARAEWERIAPGRALPEPELPEAAPVEVAVCGVGLLANPRPRVAIETSRGTLEFVLFADEAPNHVRNFLEHRDFYAGTSFHRVVSDFVVQGGDVRGDGNGGTSWRGDSLRHEIGPRKFVRGSLGMPRNEDWESGGSQIFVTHRPTPHLDGRYTLFGELTAGFEVLDRLDLGDEIVAVRWLE